MRQSLFIGALVIAASISTLVVVFQHRSSSLICSLDGIQIDSLYEVKVIGKDETSWNFSCVLSAQMWLRENSERISNIWVTDEVTGEKISSELAYYVESDVITTPHTGNRIHVFAQWKAAKLHARQYQGKFVKNPFRVRQKRSVKLVEYAPYSPDRTGAIQPSTQKPLCLTSNSLLINRANDKIISQKLLGQLIRGYASPPDKPPKVFFWPSSAIHELF